jgi:hypothetical protein
MAVSMDQKVYLNLPIRALLSVLASNYQLHSQALAAQQEAIN